ncbi:PEGA domain-containing protein [Candidatus Curtissbacteria bacterium]|nr:PEGA domain-containing protein [Candidatus Curtissbacteria bacterium]
MPTLNGKWKMASGPGPLARRENGKLFLKSLLFVTCQLSIVLLLSGCTLIGTQKPAALQVTSTPEASVFLDGKHLGKTPYFSEQLKAGEYLLKITASEASFVDKITLTSGTLTVVNRELANNFLAQSGENLWLRPQEKGLFISSQPTETDVTIDGKYIGKTPLLITDIEDGEHKVLLSQTGYVQREFAIKTASRYQLVADVSLASEIAKGINKPQVSAPQILKIEVVKAPQGFLRVRQEPQTTSTEVGRVRTGDQLEIIQETGDWIKIKFDGPPSRAGEAGKQGWIQTQFTKKL